MVARKSDVRRAPRSYRGSLKKGDVPSSLFRMQTVKLLTRNYVGGWGGMGWNGVSWYGMSFLKSPTELVVRWDEVCGRAQL